MKKYTLYDCFKIYIYSLTWSVCIAVVLYNIGNRLGLIDTIHNPIETIFFRFVIPLLGVPFATWRESDKE